MKRYKLLKDTPAIKAGAIFEEQGNFDDDKELVQVVPDGCLTKPWFAVSDIDNFDDWFEEIPEYKRRRAETGCEYYLIDDCGDIVYAHDYYSLVDNYRYNTGNYGLTEEELEAKLKYHIACQALLDDAKGGGFSYDEDNWCACYSKTFHKWVSITGNTYYPGTIYFKTREALEESLKNHKNQWTIVRKYEMGEM